jgi:hypothetical protein
MLFDGLLLRPAPLHFRSYVFIHSSLSSSLRYPRESDQEGDRHADRNRRMLKLVVDFPFSPSAFHASLQTSNFQLSNLSTGAAMSFDTQSDVKNHLSHRTRSQIHLIDPISQPDVTGDSVVASVLAESPKGSPAEDTPAFDASNLRQSAIPKTVQE